MFLIPATQKHPRLLISPRSQLNGSFLPTSEGKYLQHFRTNDLFHPDIIPPRTSGKATALAEFAEFFSVRLLGIAKSGKVLAFHTKSYKT